MSKLKDYFTLHYLVFGLPKYFSKMQMIISAIYILTYFFLSLYKIFVEDINSWIYLTILILTIFSAIILLIYSSINRQNYQTKHFKITQSYLSITANIFKMLFIGSNIIVLLSISNTFDFYIFIGLIFSSVYLAFIILSTITTVIKIVIRTINQKNHFPEIRNNQIVEYLANDIQESIRENNYQ